MGRKFRLSCRSCREIVRFTGISILRAEREVLYGVVPYITGKRGGIERVPELDRFWGCEISFPPELDEYFHVRYIKRGAEPVPSLRDKIREVIGPVVAGFRNEIKTGWKKTEAEKAQQAGVYRDAADIMTEADATQPRGERGQDVPPEVVDETLERIATESTDTTAQDTGKKKRELAAQPFSIVPVSYPQSFFEIRRKRSITLPIARTNMRPKFRAYRKRDGQLPEQRCRSCFRWPQGRTHFSICLIRESLSSGDNGI